MDPDDLDAAAADLAALAALWRKRQALIQAIEHEPRENGRASAEKDTQSAGCAVCGQAFTPHRGGPKQRYCGKTCRQRAQSEARRRRGSSGDDSPDVQDDAAPQPVARPDAPVPGARHALNGAEPPIRALCEPPALPDPSSAREGVSGQPIGEHPWNS